MKISLLILSKDRTAQLDLLLRSNKKFCGDLFSEIVVLYNTLNDRFEEGYTKLKNAYPEIKWAKDTVFENDVRRLAHEATGDAICILSDDCFFYAEVASYNDQIRKVLAREDVFSFILGIGGNSTYSGTLGYYYNMPAFQKDGDLLVWNWKFADRGEFRCPFMLAANFYKKEDYLWCLDQVRFQNPSTLECILQHTWQNTRFREMKDLCSCLPHQAVVHSLNNRVQDDFKNINGVEFPFSAHDLNELYLAGKVIDLDNLDFSKVLGLHKEINFIFKDEN